MPPARSRISMTSTTRPCRHARRLASGRPQPRSTTYPYAGQGPGPPPTVTRGAGIGCVRLRDGRRGAPDDRGEVDAAGQGAQRAAVLVAEPRRTERLGDLGRRELDEQGALEAGGHPAGQPAGAHLELGGVGERLQHALDGPVEVRVLAARLADLDEPGVEGLGLAGQGPQDVEGVDVAGALPYGVERRLAVEQRQPGLL